MIKNITFTTLFWIIAFLLISYTATAQTCTMPATVPVSATADANVGLTYSFTDIPVGTVIELITASPDDIFNIDMCATNADGWLDGDHDSSLTILDANGPTANALINIEDGCSNFAAGGNGWGPDTGSWGATAMGTYYLYITEWNAAGNFNCETTSGQTYTINIDIIVSHGIVGNLYQDISQNCIQETNENGIAAQYVMIQPGDIIAQTNDAGTWRIDSLPSGDYTVSVDTSGSWKTVCPPTQSFTVIDPNTITFAPATGLFSTTPCPVPNVSIHMPFMRPCFDDQYVYVKACNDHTSSGLLENAYVIVELDSFIQPDLTTPGLIDLGNNSYQFNMGDIYPGQCIELHFPTQLSCETELGQGLCLQANLFPYPDCVLDSDPSPSNCDTEWDKSSLEVEGYCQNDSIFFTITNTGEFEEGDMSCYSPIRVFVNGLLIILDSIQLEGGESYTYSFIANGESWLLEADQHPLHPGNSRPNAIVENCGGNTVQSMVAQIIPDDADPIVDIYCDVATGSYDPNDKTGYPLGISEEHLILPNQKLEYKIRFQNTGTDTAFTVVIRDTLSTDFDIFSVQSLTSSHSYEFNMYGPRVLEWTFNDIMLPDSTTNEPESHGFVVFTVEQNPDLAEGIVLSNSAAIYFDFNDPIITNTSVHTIDYFDQELITNNISEFACTSFTSTSGETWTQSGTYYDVSSSNDINYVTTIDLTIGEIDDSVEESNTGLKASLADASYQWLDCDNNFEPIQGEILQEFSPLIDGNYAVEISKDGCTQISDCYIFLTINNDDLIFTSSIDIYPNPLKENLNIDFSQIYEGVSISIKNTLGQVVQETYYDSTQQVLMELNEDPGLYLLEIKTKNDKYAIFKIIVQ